jgi:hypothetical protein
VRRGRAYLAICLAGATAITGLGCLDLSALRDNAHVYFYMPLSGWRADPAWNDGRAEKCVYEATRSIYGVERRYLAVAYTNKEHVDPATTCKSLDGTGIEVFKHHWSEIVPTEKYDYRFSTMSYRRVDPFVPFKLTVSTQEDCGASFKECWEQDREWKWSDSVYFPGGGRRSGRLDPIGGMEFGDALSIALRGWLIGETLPEGFLHVVPSQKDTHQVSWEPVRRRVRDQGTSTQELPIGKLEAREFDVLDSQDKVVERYWFATDAKPPMLNALVRYEGPGGVTYRLKSIERTKYWER